MTFSKIDKKVLTILIIVLSVTVIIGFFVLKYMVNGAGANIQNSVGGVSIES